jgi:hypothetical protein
MHGHVHDERQKLVENPGETDDVLRLGLTVCRSADSPYCEASPILASYDGVTEFECGLGILLTGLATTLIPRRRDAPAARSPARP